MNQQWNELSDSDAVELSKENPDVFEVLVLRYQERLFHYIKRISYFDSEDAEDIIQEIFIKAYRSLNDFDDSFKFSTWIYRIARNATIDAIRKKQVRPQAARLEPEDLVKIFHSNIDIENEVIAKDDLNKVKEIIDKMSFKYKEVLVLRFLEEKTYEEIMDILGKPKGTVAALVNRGRKILLEEIKKQEINLSSK